MSELTYVRSVEGRRFVVTFISALCYHNMLCCYIYFSTMLSQYAMLLHLFQHYAITICYVVTFISALCYHNNGYCCSPGIAITFRLCCYDLLYHAILSYKEGCITREHENFVKEYYNLHKHVCC